MDRIAELLELAGFVVTGRTLQEPEEGAKRPVSRLPGPQAGRRHPAGVIGPSSASAPCAAPQGASRPVAPYAAARSPTGRLRRATSVSEGGVHAPSGG